MPRGGLSATGIIDAAAALADEQGRDALTVRALAERLGVHPPSIYKHLDSLDAKKRGVALKGLCELNSRIIRATVGLSREEALVAFAQAYWRFSREHPGLYATTLEAVSPGDGEIGAAGGILVDVISSVLEGFRLTGNNALHASRAMRAIVHGFVSLDASGVFGTGENLEESFVRLIRNFAAGLASGAPTLSDKTLFRFGRFSLRG